MSGSDPYARHMPLAGCWCVHHPCTGLCNTGAAGQPMWAGSVVVWMAREVVYLSHSCM